MSLTKQIGRYIVIMLLQVLLFNQLQLWDVCHPYVYILCLLMMPITLPHSIEMLIGFGAGLIMDIFCNSIGVHASSCVLLMFLRPYMLGTVTNDKERLNEQISAKTIGMDILFKYVAILVIVHHATVFLLSAWSWSHIGFVLAETAVSGAVTILVILGYNLLAQK